MKLIEYGWQINAADGFASKVAKPVGESRYHQAVAGGPDT